MPRLVAVISLVALSLLSGCASLRGAAGDVLSGKAACARPAAFTPAAMANTDSLGQLAWSPFGRPEQGWAIYSLRIQREIKSRCAPQTAGFAYRLAIWQADHALEPTGVFDAVSFQTMKTGWQNARPYIVLRAAGICPDPPPDEALGPIRASDVFPGKTILLRKAAMPSLHRMLKAAWTHAAGAGSGPNKLVVFSGFRSPTYDADRCLKEGNCDGVGRAACSVHRTGLAVDLVLGFAPGYAVDSSADANRLYQTRTPAYRWLVDNAGRFGFVNYPFEPWHWEWTGQAP
jgi:D-alanyl-D-alanine carboxypeptidase